MRGAVRAGRPGCSLHRIALVGAGFLLVASLGDADQPGKKIAPVVIQPEPYQIKVGEPLSALTLVSQPTPIENAQSWTIDTRRHRGRFHAMALSPDGSQLATGGTDGTVRI